MTRFGFARLVDVLREGVEEVGIRPYARQLDVPIGVLRSVTEGRDPSASNLLHLADAVGFEVYVGPPREQPDLRVVTTNFEDYATIETTGLEVAAGPGRSVDAMSTAAPLAFRKDWLRRAGIDAKNARLLRARGESMEPLIWDGDALMLDISRTDVPVRPEPTKVNRRVPAREVYVLERDGDLRVKTVRRPADDRMILFSENTRLFEPEMLVGSDLDDLRILGKVVWWGHVAT